MNAFRREGNHYLEPESEEYKDTPRSKHKKSEEEEIHRMARRLDPAGKYFEDAGDIEAAKESRIAQAQKFTSGGYVNYGSAAVLYEQAGDYKKAIENYQNLLADSKHRPWNSDMTIETKLNISRLEKKMALQKVENRKKLAILTVSILGIFGSAFFLSSNMTGNAIADLSTNTTSWVSEALLIVGLVAGFFWIRNRKK